MSSSSPAAGPPFVVDGVLVMALAPAGYVVNFANPQQHFATEHYAIFGVMGTLATVALAQRLYTKVVLSKGLGIDDCESYSCPSSWFPLLTCTLEVLMVGSWVGSATCPAFSTTILTNDFSAYGNDNPSLAHTYVSRISGVSITVILTHADSFHVHGLGVHVYEMSLEHFRYIMTVSITLYPLLSRGVLLTSTLARLRCWWPVYALWRSGQVVASVLLPRALARAVVPYLRVVLDWTCFYTHFCHYNAPFLPLHTGRGIMGCAHDRDLRRCRSFVHGDGHTEHCHRRLDLPVADPHGSGLTDGKSTKGWRIDHLWHWFRVSSYVPFAGTLHHRKSSNTDIVLIDSTIMTSGIRLGLLPALLKATDVPWDAAPANVWSFIEANLFVICGSMPTLRKFFKHFAPRLIGSYGNSTAAGYGDGPSGAYGGNGSSHAYAKRSQLSRPGEYSRFGGRRDEEGNETEDDVELGVMSKNTVGGKRNTVDIVVSRVEKGTGRKGEETDEQRLQDDRSDRAILTTRTVVVAYE